MCDSNLSRASFFEKIDEKWRNKSYFSPHPCIAMVMWLISGVGFQWQVFPKWRKCAVNIKVVVHFTSWLATVITQHCIFIISSWQNTYSTLKVCQLNENILITNLFPNLSLICVWIDSFHARDLFMSLWFHMVYEIPSCYFLSPLLLPLHLWW